MPAPAATPRRLDEEALRRSVARAAAAPQPPWLHAEVARRMAQRLAIVRLRPQRIVDWSGFMGAGEALLAQAYPDAERFVVEADARLAQRSRDAARAPWWAARRWRGAPVQVLDAADALPAGVQLVWSNMLLHTIADPPALLARWGAALAADGFVMFSCFGPGTLAGLRALYRAQGWGTPTQGFVDMHDIGDMLVHAGFADPVMDQETLTLSWDNAERLLAELRTLGGNVAPDRFGGMRTPRWRARLLRGLETLAGADGKPRLAFEVVYGHAFKGAPRLHAGAPTTIALEDMRALLRAGANPADARPACAKAQRSIGVADHPSTAARQHSSMSASSSIGQNGRAAAGPALRLGREVPPDGAGEAPVQWHLKRNCSMAPGQLFAIYASLCLLSLAIAGFLWTFGATLVLPFASLELVLVGVALLVYARHAADGESICLQGGRLTVEQSWGTRTLRVDFQPAWVRVEPEYGDRSLVELSGQGRRVVVGRFVRPELRRQLADELRWALRGRAAAA